MTKTKLTAEELQQLVNIQNQTQQIIKEFGQITIAEINLEKRKANTTTYLTKLRELETALAKSLEEKYGKGTVNLESGEFVSI